MKKLTFLIFALVSMQSSMSQSQNNLIIFSDDGATFTLFLNNVQQHEFPESNVWVGGLNAPGYKAKIVFEDASKGVVEKNIPFLDPNTEITLRLVEKKGTYKLRFFSESPIPVQYQPQPNQRAITVVTQPVYTETTTTTVINNGNTDSVNMDVNIDGVGVGINVNVTEGGNNGVVYQETTTTTTTTSGGATADHYIMQGYGGPIGCPWPMEAYDFEEAKRTIASKTFDDTRLTLAKQIIASNCLFADQVRDLASLMEFEDSKLEFAKFAYGYTYDIGNYFKVSQIFDFESSVEELNEYIAGY